MHKSLLLFCAAIFCVFSLDAKVQNKKTLSSPSIALHKVSSLFRQERSIILEDGSQWSVSSLDIPTFTTWRSGDTISILPNYAWFTSFSYILVNENNQSRLQANLEEGPSLFNPACLWVTDMQENHIFLQNGMSFCVAQKDEPLLEYWAINDPIIVGTEDSAWTHHPLILINVNTNEFVRATQY